MTAVFLKWIYCLGSICETYLGCELWSWIDSNFASSSGAAINDCYMKTANAANSKRPETGVVSGSNECGGQEPEPHGEHK